MEAHPASHVSAKKMLDERALLLDKTRNVNLAPRAVVEEIELGGAEEVGGVSISCAMGNEDQDMVHKGRLVALKTTLESKASYRTVEVFVTSVKPKDGNNTLKLVQRLLPDSTGLDVQHLRRFAKYGEVPATVRSAFDVERSKQAGESLEASSISENEVSRDLFLVVGSINSISRSVVLDALSSISSSPILFTTHVPQLAPTSSEQAVLLTSLYWPTVYKKSNPFGPHPSIVSRAEEEIGGDVKQWMGLASEVARSSEEKGLGERIGVVIVERKAGVVRVVAVAGDARWFGWGKGEGRGEGNPAAHAVMRAVGLVASVLRDEGQRDAVDDASSESPVNDNNTLKNASSSTEIRQEDQTDAICKKAAALEDLQEAGSPHNEAAEHFQKEQSTPILDIFQDKPLLELEAQYLHSSSDGNGYLCHGLEIYCTHEPCVMCSMAIIHSRFSKIVFARRMEGTGGMCSHGELGHGLFWRKELNWTMLAWQWDDSSMDDVLGETSPHLHA